MDLYLPIAEMSVNLFWLLGLGAAVGFLSGVFGVGGGFVMTPLLIFIGVPPAVAVGTQASQILASSFSSVLSHLRRRTVDIKIGTVLAVGGLIGSTLGVLLFTWLKRLGHIDIVISLSYVVFLGSVGSLMFYEGLQAWLSSRRRLGGRRKLHHHNWLHGLPFKMRFPQSRLYISVLVPIFVGVFGGILAAILGIGGGFVLIPAMIYIIGMPTAVVVGTSHFQITFVAAATTFLHAYNNQSVDIVLALLLTAGGVVGAQFGTRAGVYLRGEHVRILLALLVLAVCAKLAYDLVARPEDLYSLGL